MLYILIFVVITLIFELYNYFYYTTLRYKTLIKYCEQEVAIIKSRVQYIDNNLVFLDFNHSNLISNQDYLKYEKVIQVKDPSKIVIIHYPILSLFTLFYVNRIFISCPPFDDFVFQLHISKFTKMIFCIVFLIMLNAIN